jgi:Protein of unknown function (DUF1194)
VLPLVALVLTQITFARAAEQVDLLLALAMDVSRSMDQSKFKMQREGYAAAIANPQVLSAIRSGAHQKIAICFIDWSGPFEQRLVVDWSVVDGIDTAVHLGDLISRAPRSFYNSTSIGSAIDFAVTQIARAPFESERHAIDVSGDGTNNSGRDVRFFRDRAVAQRIVVSGLVILTDIQLAQYPAHTNPPGGIEKYYRDNVIGGPGSFVMVAEDYNSFGRAMVKKLIAEIATAPQIYAQHRPSRKQGDHDEQLRASSVPPTHPHERSIRCRRPHAPPGRRLRPATGLGADAFLS